MSLLIGLFSLLSLTDVEIVEEVELLITQLELEAKGMGFSTPWTKVECKVKVEDIPRDEFGVPVFLAYVRFVKPHELVVDRSTWKISPFPFKEMLIAHELGHCKLLRPHTKECRIHATFENVCPYPKSLMFPYMSAKDYEQMRTYYLTELFSTYYTDYRELLNQSREGNNK